MTLKKFKHIPQKGRFEVKLAKSKDKGPTFNGGEFGCGIACAAMIAGTRFEKAIINLIKDGLNLKMINWILEKHGVKVHPSRTTISRKRFKKGSKGKTRFFDKVRGELKKSTVSLLVGTEDHWLLYDVVDGKIKDPDAPRPMSIDKFINEYSEEKKFYLYRVGKSQIKNQR